MMTRKEYMTHPEPERAHKIFFDQFVCPDVLALVGRHIGVNRIKASKCPHFNDIDLVLWDKLARPLRHIIGAQVAMANEYGGTSLADMVYVAKAAARHIRGF